MESILTLKMFLGVNSWNDYFSGVTPNENIKNKFLRGYLQNYHSYYGNTYVFSSIFKDLHYSDNVSIIHVSGAALMVESSLFINCNSTEGYGGAIRGSVDQCIITKTCGSKCHNTREGHFCFMQTEQVDGYKNYFKDCSISQTYNPDEIRCVRLDGGNAELTGCNFSNNNLFYSSSFELYLCITCIVSHTTIIRNVAGLYIASFGSSPQFTMKYCNLVNNQGDSVVDASFGSLTVTDSCFLFNTVEKTFDIYKATIKVVSCAIDTTIGDAIVESTIDSKYTLYLEQVKCITVPFITQDPMSIRKNKIGLSFRHFYI